MQPLQQALLQLRQFASNLPWVVRAPVTLVSSAAAGAVTGAALVPIFQGPLADSYPEVMAGLFLLAAMKVVFLGNDGPSSGGPTAGAPVTEHAPVAPPTAGVPSFRDVFSPAAGG